MTTEKERSLQKKIDGLLVENEELRRRADKAEKELAHYKDNCTSVWMIADVESACRELNYNRPSKIEGRAFLKYVERKQDAQWGISWDTLYNYLDMWTMEDDENWPIKMPDAYYESMDDTQWGDHPLNNREVEYNDR